MDEELEAQLKEVLKHERFGADSYGYFFIIDKKGVLVLHPIEPGLIGKPISEIKTPSGDILGTMFSNALSGDDGAFVNYKWFAPNGSGMEGKTSYLLKIKTWGWTVGAGSTSAISTRLFRRNRPRPLPR